MAEYSKSTVHDSVGEGGNLRGNSLCSEGGGEVICERTDSWDRTGDLRAMESLDLEQLF